MSHPCTDTAHLGRAQSPGCLRRPGMRDAGPREPEARGAELTRSRVRSRDLVQAVLDVPALALIVLIRLYQLTLSKMMGQVCRFEPSCSRYAAACLADHGALKGSWLAVRRLLRCHPFHPGGYDPPPPPHPNSWRSGAGRGLFEAVGAAGRRDGSAESQRTELG